MSLASAHAASCLKLPYGYQIDLDFIKYCESLTNPDPSEVEFKRRQKRRQRQSMEVMLGIQKEMQDEMDRLSEIWEKPDTPPEPPPRSHHHFIDTPIVPQITRAPFNSQPKWDESLIDVVDDFEKTLQRSNSQRTKQRVHNDDCIPTKQNSKENVPKRELPNMKKMTFFDLPNSNSTNQNPSTESLVIRDLEEKAKLIPILQIQIQKLKDERQQLLMQLERASASSSASTHSQNGTSNVFQAQRVSPVSLNPIKITTNIVPKRTVGTNTAIVLQREVGCSPSAVTKVTQSCSTDMTVRIEKNDEGKLYTEKDLRRAIEMAHSKMRKITSTVGVQSEIKPSTCSIGCATENLNLVTSLIEGVSIPSTIMETSTSSDQLNASTSFLSLQDMAKPPTTRSNSTQTQKLQTYTRDQSTQFMPSSSNKSTESDDLIRVAHKPSMTEIVHKCEQSVNTSDLIKVTQTGVNTDALPIVHKKSASTNTSQLIVKSVGITTDQVQEPTTPTAINRTLNLPILPSKIPRHQPNSPNTNRKFTRQDTFTVATSNLPTLPTKEQQECPAEKLFRLTMTSSDHQNDSIAEEDEVKVERNLSSLECETIADDKPPSDEKHDAVLSTIDEFKSERPLSPTIEYNEFEEVSEEEEEDEEEDEDEDEEDDKFYDGDVPSTMRPPPTSISTIRLCQQNRLKIKPSKEMISALKVINDLLKKPDFNESEIQNAREVAACEWFHISSTENSISNNVEDYLDYFEEQSWELLTYMVNLNDKNGNSALHYAVSHKNFDVVSILLDSKVGDVNKTNNAGYTCVMLVSLAKELIPEHQTVVRRLFKLSDVNIRASKNSQTALMLAVSHGNFLITTLLVEASADINIQDDDGSTALMCAAEHGYEDIVKFLLAQPDCDSTKQDVDGNTALKIALEAGYHDIGCLLYAHEHILRNKSTLRRTSSMKSSTSSLN